MVPSPGSLPNLARVNFERVQDHNESRESAEGRFFLRTKLRRQWEEAFHVAFIEGFSEDGLAFRGTKRGTHRGERTTIELVNRRIRNQRGGHGTLHQSKTISTDIIRFRRLTHSERLINNTLKLMLLILRITLDNYILLSDSAKDIFKFKNVKMKFISPSQQDILAVFMPHHPVGLI